MDTITHGLIGTLGSQAGYYQKFGKLATISFLTGSIFPDIDVLVSIMGPDFMMRYHRGLTHSLIAAPLFCLFLTLAVGVIFRSNQYIRIYPMVLLGILSHIFFDLITSYGTVLFDPITSKRYSWNLVFILDPFITLPVLAGLIISIKKKQVAARLSSIVLVFLLIYLSTSYIIKNSTLERMLIEAEKKDISAEKFNIYPKPFSPFRWLGVLETEEDFYRVNIDYIPVKPLFFEKIPKSDSNGYVEAANSHRVAVIYKWFADFPVVRYRKIKHLHIVEFQDLRFRMLSKRKPFTLKYIFDENTKIKEITLGGRKVKDI